MTVSVELTNHADPLICRQCRGLCCQAHAGLWLVPERFLRLFRLPRPASPSELQSQLPAQVVLKDLDGVAVPAPSEDQNGCVFLTATGCTLPERYRPGQCLLLQPVLETLIDGEIKCELKPEGSTARARQNWSNFWAVGRP